MMSKRENLIPLAGVTAIMAFAIAVPVVQADDTIAKETRIETESLPAAIVKQIHEQHPDAKIEEVSLVRETYYEMELQSASGEIEISLYPDGSEVEGGDGGAGGFRGGFDEVVDFNKLPKAVQDGITESLILTGFDLIERDEKDGIVYYKAIYQGEAGQSQIRVTEAGDIVDRRTRIFAESLPGAVVERINDQFPNAELADATEFQETYYRVAMKPSSDEVVSAYFADGSAAHGK